MLMMTTTRRIALITALALAVTATAAIAQPSGQGSGPAMGPGMMMGPGAMHRGMHSRMCGPRAAGFAEWRIDRLERAIKPTAAQRAKFDELKVAAAKSAEIVRTACPTEVPLTMPGRMAAMEKRMDAMLQAIKTMRPALEAFYATLSDEQKARFDSAAGAGRFWRWHWRDRM